MKKSDFFITILFLLMASFFIQLFWNEYTRTLTKLNEAPVGTITYKKRTAQRKFIDRVIWDMLKQASSVYNADTLRTIDLSEAVILFRDEVTQITMYANTIIQIFYNDIDGARVDFSGGNMEVNSGSAGVTIISGSSEIVIDGLVYLDKRDEGFVLFVLEGEAVFDGEVIKTDNMLILNEYGERSIRPSIAMTSFNTSMRITSEPGTITPVVFSWNGFNFDSDTFVIVETALDPAYKHIVQTANVTNNTTASIPLENGNYFWRVYPAAIGSREPASPMYPQGTLEIVSAPEIVSVPFAEIEEIFMAEEIEETANTTVIAMQEITSEPAATTTPASVTPTTTAATTASTTRLTSGEGVFASGTFSGNGNYYEVVDLQRITWEEAKVEAERRGGHLVTITSAEENNFVRDLVRQGRTGGYWSGGQKIDGNWVWITGEAFIYRKWANGQPDNNNKNEDKIEILRTTNWGGNLGEWCDAPNNNHTGFIIEYPASTKPSSVAPNLYQTLFNKNNWETDAAGANSSLISRTIVNMQSNKEQIQGQEKDVLTFEVDLPRNFEYWKAGFFWINHETVIKKLRAGSGIRFKLLSDSGRIWRVMIEAPFPRQYEVILPVTDGQIVEVDIPFTKFGRFNKDNIQNLVIQRKAITDERFSGPSSIKIFDFEIY